MKRNKLILMLSTFIIIAAIGTSVLTFLNKAQNDTIANGKAKDITTGSSSSSTSEDKSTAQEAEKENTIQEQPLKIMAAGDIHLARGVEYHIDRIGKGYTYPLEKIADMLKRGDIIFGNLENPFTTNNHPVYGKIAFRSRPEAFEAVKFGGFNLINIANNHIMDQYDKGLFDTIDLLESNGITYAGAGRNLEEARKPAIIEKNGIKIGMLSYTDMAYDIFKGDPPMSFAATDEKAGVAPRKLEYIKEDIEKLRDQVDLLLVSLHWGVEYVYEVQPEQVDFARQVLDLGADGIIGHHPHRMKGIEIYKGKPIIYSLGNLVSDQNDPNNQEGFILEMDYTGTQLKSLSGIPFKIQSKSQAVPVFGKDAEYLLNKEKEISEALGSTCKIENDRLVFVLE